MGLVLGQHADLADTRVQAVGKAEIDDAELAAERYRRFGAPIGQHTKTGPPSPGQDDGKGVVGEAADKSCWLNLNQSALIRPKCTCSALQEPCRSKDTLHTPLPAKRCPRHSLSPYYHPSVNKSPVNAVLRLNRPMSGARSTLKAAH